jgi:hypothetical protein
MFSQHGKYVHVMSNKHTFNGEEYAQILLLASVTEMQGQ